MINLYELYNGSTGVELVAEKCITSNDVMFDSPESIMSFCNNFLKMSALADERIYLFTLNNQHSVTGVFLIGKGDAQSCLCDVCGIALRVLMMHATSYVLVHNHPSGTVTPSKMDDNMTLKCVQLASLCGLNFLDHVICGKYGYYSYCCKDRLNKEALR